MARIHYVVNPQTGMTIGALDLDTGETRILTRQEMYLLEAEARIKGDLPGAEGAKRAIATQRPLQGLSQNNRGMTKEIVLPTLVGSNGQPLKVPSIVETAKMNGDDAEVLSVQLGTTYGWDVSDPALSALNPSVLALVEWGVGGAYFSAEVDWNQGGSFAVTASFLRVSAEVAAIPALLVSDQKMSLSAAIGYGNPSTLNVSSPLRRTVLAYPPAPSAPKLAAGAAFSCPIPAWAVGCTVVDGGIGAGAGNTAPPNTQVNIDNVVYTVTDRSNQSDHVEGMFPIHAGARTLMVTNNSLNPLWYPTIIFNLAF
jgi:hypothetical protein